jgi:hypothetical protein
MWLDNQIEADEHTHIIRWIKPKEDLSTRVVRILHREEVEKSLNTQSFFAHALAKISKQERSPFLLQEQFQKRYTDLFIPANLWFSKTKEDAFIPAFPDIINEPHVFNQKSKRWIRGFAYTHGL